MSTRSPGRNLQKARTRRALLDAAAELMRQGRAPTVAEAAEAAMVSTATAYRYFSSPQSLWLEVSIQAETPTRDEVFGDVHDDGVEARVDALVRRIAWPQFDDEALWRTIARAALERWFEQASLPEQDRVPIRGTHRMAWVTDALAPLEGRVPGDVFRRLTMALALVVGMDAMIALRDSCHLEPDEARDVQHWAAMALLRAADEELAEPSG